MREGFGKTAWTLTELCTLFREEAQRVGAVVQEAGNWEDAFRYIIELAKARGVSLVAISQSSLPHYQELVQRLAQEGIQAVLPGEAPAQGLRRALTEAGMGISGADLGIAESGTLVLVRGDGRDRLVTALPPLHVALFSAHQLVHTLADAMVILKGWGDGYPPAHISLITGPSRTADIETALVIGVHGPKEVHILILKEREGKEED
ncbi:MAG: lactate utilization protein [candidate division NC10 bacterium]|nr:lactate utilization protein [candidate division NC10 bacterium]